MKWLKDNYPYFIGILLGFIIGVFSGAWLSTIFDVWETFLGDIFTPLVWIVSKLTGGCSGESCAFVFLFTGVIIYAILGAIIGFFIVRIIKKKRKIT